MPVSKSLSVYINFGATHAFSMDDTDKTTMKSSRTFHSTGTIGRYSPSARTADLKIISTSRDHSVFLSSLSEALSRCCQGLQGVISDLAWCCCFHSLPSHTITSHPSVVAAFSQVCDFLRSCRTTLFRRSIDLYIIYGVHACSPREKTSSPLQLYCILSRPYVFYRFRLVCFVVDPLVWGRLPR